MISVTAIVVAADFIGSIFHRPLLRPEERRILFPAIAVAGIALYLATFGVLRMDIYRAGFSPFALIALAFAAALVAGRAPRLACAAIVILAAFDCSLLRSRNLFDYALDPFVVFVAIGWCVFFAWRVRSASGRAGAADAGATVW